MAILFLDGCTHYGTADLSKKYTAVGAQAIYKSGGRLPGTGVLGGTGFSITDNFVRKDVTPATPKEGYLGMSDDGQTGNFTATQVLDGDTPQLTLGMNSGGAYLVRLGGATGTIIATGTAGGITGAHYVEWGWYIDSTSGWTEVRIWYPDGTGGTNLYFSGNTQFTSAARWTGFLNNTSAPGSNGDIYLLDASGTRNNSFLGDVYILTGVPIADDSVDMSPNTGDNYAAVDDPAPIDADATYVRATTSGLIDTYQITQFDDYYKVFGVQANITAARESSETPVSLNDVVSQEGVPYHGTSQSVSVSYNWYREIREVQPIDSTSEWTIDAINAARWGHRRSL